MPRVKLAGYEKKYIEKKISEYIIGRMAVKKVRQADLAEALDMSQPMVGKKVNTGRMSAKEFFIIMNVLEAPTADIERLVHY